MSDFIRRSAVIDALLQEFPQINVPMVQIALERLSAVDAVKVVRCKDCEHYLSVMYGSHCQLSGTQMDKDGYCSYGERREGNEID